MSPFIYIDLDEARAARILHLALLHRASVSHYGSLGPALQEHGDAPRLVLADATVMNALVLVGATWPKTWTLILIGDPNTEDLSGIARNARAPYVVTLPEGEPWLEKLLATGTIPTAAG
jgi:hypothetical protein